MHSRLVQNVKSMLGSSGQFAILSEKTSPYLSTIQSICNSRVFNACDDTPDLSNISFLCVDASVEYTIRTLSNLLNKLQYGSTIYIPEYNSSNSGYWSKFISENFMHTYESKNLKGLRESYLAIKWLKNPPIRKKKVDNLTVMSVLNANPASRYSVKHVHALYRSCKKHIRHPFRFVCLTNLPQSSFGWSGACDIEAIPLKHNFPGWWAKMEMFRHDVCKPKEHVLYLDLDTLIISDITDIAIDHTDFMTMRDFNMLHDVSSGIMKYDAFRCYSLYDGFMQNPRMWMSHKLGDQVAIQKMLEANGQSIEWLQDAFPRRMAEFKNHCYNQKTGEISTPSNYSIVCFHGKPKMDDLANHPYIKCNWDNAINT